MKKELTLKNSVAMYLALAMVFGNAVELLFFTSPKVAEAAYVGKHLRTVEFVLGGGAASAVMKAGTLTSSQTTDTNIYAGTEWNTTKASAGTKTITIPGTGIRVLSAYIDTTFNAITSANVTDLELALDVSPGPSPGELIILDTVGRNGTALLYTETSGVSQFVGAKADATALFQTQTDGEFNAGLSVLGMLSVTGPTINLATMKLIVTYEQDYSTTAHTELKTVRYPLISTVAGDSGSRGTVCTAGSTCSFTYSLYLPDMATTTDIVDAWFEISAVDDGNATLTTSINGGAASVAHTSGDALADSAQKFLIYRPQIGGVNLGTSTQQLDIAVATAAVSGLGGEVVVTYKFSTGATTQVETVQYMAGQGVTVPGTATTSFSLAPTIANASRDPLRIWHRIQAPIAQSMQVHAQASVGSSASTSRNYNLTIAQPRTGSVTLFHDVGVATTSWASNQTNLLVATRQDSTTGDAIVGVETMITFAWNGSSHGAVTKTGKFFAGSSGSVQGVAAMDMAFPFVIRFPETVTKTYRSAYLPISITHSQAGSVSLGTISVSLSGSGQVVFSETGGDTETFRGKYLKQATSTGFTADETIATSTFAFSLIVHGSAADEYAVSQEMVVTYDAALGAPSLPATLEFLHYRFRNDDGDEVNASFATGEDTALTSGKYLGDRIRLRMLISNTGTGATTTQFRLEYATVTPDFWVQVPVTSVSEHWETALSQYIPDGAVTTDNSGLTNPTGQNFIVGQVRVATTTASSILLGASEFTEMEWSIISTAQSVAGLNYFFRLTNDGSLLTYSVTPLIVIEAANKKPVAGGESVEGSVLGVQREGGDESGGEEVEESGGGIGVGGGNQSGGGNSE